ncbi:hypothetical protein [Aggregatilinea lenta]|uniref:hypothetical protein n=1 Tax=Aggregatilinea lenta TaxID=913108 RepID=UPI000E5A7E42|nr:hypothetical protein [Aggregatilinea lenta]
MSLSLTSSPSLPRGRRFLARIAALLLVVCALAAVAAHVTGTQIPSRAFPLPTTDTCWQRICFFDFADSGAVIAALDADPDLAAHSVGLVMAGYPGGYTTIRATYAPGGASPLPVLVYWSDFAYHFTVDWHLQRPLMRLGDVIAALGPPSRVNFVSDKLVLRYDDRYLRVFVLPTAAADGWGVLPTDAVVTVEMTNPDASLKPFDLAQPGSQPWHGFGRYTFAS